MKLTDIQQDALIEVCNVGMSKAAKQLSLLLNGPVLLEIPEITLIPVDRLPHLNIENPSEPKVIVQQNLQDNFEGMALLVFRRDYSQALFEHVIGEAPHLSEVEMRSCEQEAMLEIGNIVISSCMSSMVDMVKERVALTVPYYYENTLADFLTSHRELVNYNGSNVVMIISTILSTERGNFSGRLMLFISPLSIQRILDAIDKLMQGD